MCHSQNMTVAARATAREEDLGAPVVAGADPAPVLQSAEHELDSVAAFVAALVMILDDGPSDRFPPIATIWSRPALSVILVADGP